MCGILALASVGPDPIATSDADIGRMRDVLGHRGPDGSGIYRSDGREAGRPGGVVLAHRRLAVIDPSPAGRQPMSTPDGRFWLSYNGELYNDAELRRDLCREGVEFTSRCDTETVLLSLAAWGEGALDRFRGMYAIALHDARENTLLLARDPLGIKPLYLWRGSIDGRPSFVAASEIPAILAHPDISAEPDPVGILSYLTTLRTSIGRRTMFAGIETLLPGERVRIGLSGTSATLDRAVESLQSDECVDRSDLQIEAAIEDSVVRHLRSDVPMCCLLSGGVDSSIIATIASEHCGGSLHTYCAGARDSGVAESADFASAALMARLLGTDHREVAITRSGFLDRWRELVSGSGSPLSTPNEVAIYEVARAMRADGHVVTLSGEGADELFGGYTGALELAQACIDSDGSDPAAFQLDTFAWLARASRGAVLNAGWFGRDSWLGDGPVLEAYRTIWDGCCSPSRGDEALLGHMRFQREINLSGLVRRLDSMTMLAGVEGRTPMADVEIARLGDALPVDRRYVAGSLGKLALRGAFAHRLPEEIAQRPKASFPLPFETWIEPAGGWLRGSAFAREIFTSAAIESVGAEPSGLWQLAWPMVNVSLWGDRWF